MPALIPEMLLGDITSGRISTFFIQKSSEMHQLILLFLVVWKIVGGGKLNFDKCIATPSYMPRLGKV